MRIQSRIVAALASVGLLIWGMGAAEAQQEAGARDRPPNIVLIYADDLGYGDIGPYGGKRAPTPNLDKLATESLRFTDAHSAAATCTPSRYALLTGEYAWRKPGTGILPGDAALIIEPGRPTLPSVLKDAGYATGAVGKWHLGLGKGKINWNEKLAPGPLEIGFDHCFIIPATVDRVPCVYVEDHHVVGLDPADPIFVNYKEKVGDEPTGRENPELLKMKSSHGHDQTIVNGIGRIGWMEGGNAARWTDEDIADVFASKAVKFIEQNQKGPFFLYLATHDVHVPRVPHPRFVGRSKMGARGDVITEFDDTVGQVLQALDRLNLADDTLVIVTSDNGPVVDDGYQDEAEALLGDHRPAGPWRGGKYTAFEGGTRMPMLIRWPGRVAPGVSDALVCQVDFPASLASLAGREFPKDAGPDGRNVLDALLGKSKQGREELVEQGGGVRTALRQGAWKFIPAPNAKEPKGQLYNLADDPAETQNLAPQNPDRVAAMWNRLKEIRGE